MNLYPYSIATMTEDYRLTALLKKVKKIKHYEFSGRTTHGTAVSYFSSNQFA